MKLDIKLNPLMPRRRDRSDRRRHNTSRRLQPTVMALRRFSAAVFVVVVVLVSFLALTAAGSDADDAQCVYTVYIRTGSVIKAGTDANIGLTLGDAYGRRFEVADLVSWGGLMGPGYDYYERGALDVFSGRGPCGLASPICSLNLTSDGAGKHHGWYCEYVEVTATGPHAPCTQTLFYVRQWLATDAAPYRLYATVDGCGEQAASEGRRRLVIGNEPESSSSSAM